MATNNIKKKEEIKDSSERNNPIMENFLEKILKGERITKEINIEGRGKFVIVFPLPSDLNAIEIRVAEMLGGYPQSSFSEISLSNFRAFATLDHVIVDSPNWWKKMSSAQDCPDINVVQELYRGYLRFFKRTQGIIAKSRLGKDNGPSQSEVKKKNVGSGAFSDLADGEEI